MKKKTLTLVCCVRIVCILLCRGLHLVHREVIVEREDDTVEISYDTPR